MGSRADKNAVYDGFAGVGKAFSNGRRAELIDLLAQGERHVDELAGELGQSVANTSFHLRGLAAAGLVATQRRGTRIYYRLASPDVERLWWAVRAVAEQGAALESLVAAYVGDRSDVETVDRGETGRRISDHDTVILDVRPAAEFAAGHLPGAVSIRPQDLDRELTTLLGAVPDGVDFIAYCRGPFCVHADEAVRALQRAGRRARRLEDGFPEWRRAGLPVEAA